MLLPLPGAHSSQGHFKGIFGNAPTAFFPFRRKLSATFGAENRASVHNQRFNCTSLIL